MPVISARFMRTTSPRAGCPSRPYPAPQELHGSQGHEARVVVQVPLPEPPGLHGEAEEPLEAPVLHPRRRLLHAPRVEVERRPYPQLHQRQPVLVSGHPALLLRAAEADEEDPDAGGEYVLHDPLVLLGRELPERRRVRVADVEVGEAPEELRLEAVDGLGRATVEPYGHALAGRCFAYVQG